MVSVLVDAIVAGAAAALQGSVADALKRTYDHLRTLLSRDEQVRDAVSLLEKDPSSEARATVVREALEKSDLPSDKAVLTAAQRLIEELRSAYPADSMIVRRLAGKNITFRRFETEASSAVFEDMKAGEDITFEDVSHKKKQ